MADQCIDKNLQEKLANESEFNAQQNQNEYMSK